MTPDTLEYHALFVAPEYPLLLRGIPMLAESIRRQVAAGIFKGTWGVMATNAPMLKFVARRMAPYVTMVAEEKKSLKPLGGATRE
jgi:hypothetical protein